MQEFLRSLFSPDFLRSVLSNALAECLVVIGGFFVGYISRSLQSQRQVHAEQELGMHTGASVATTVNQFIERQAQVIRRRSIPRTPVVEHRTVIEYRDTSSAEESPWLFILGIVFALAIADTIWVQYQLPMLYVILGGSGIGLGTSVYLIVQLQRMRPPRQMEDYLLSWGGFAVWLISIVTAWLAVYYPLYKEPTGDWAAMDLWFVHAMQLVGMLLLFACIAATALIQFVAGRVYQKALQNVPPNRMEIAVWEWRIFVFAGIAISIIAAFLLGTGVLF